MERNFKYWCPNCTKKNGEYPEHKETVNMQLECKKCGRTNYQISFIEKEKVINCRVY